MPTIIFYFSVVELKYMVLIIKVNNSIPVNKFINRSLVKNYQKTYTYIHINKKYTNKH